MAARFGLVIATLAAPLLMGCQSKPEPPSAEQAAAIKETCQSQDNVYDWFIGQPLQEVRDFFPVGDRKFGVREPGGVYTQQFILGRTLVHLDEEGRIVRVRCG